MASKYLMNDWAAITAHYDKYRGEILANPAHGYAIDPYEWDMGQGMIHFTPIESAMWSDIRCEGITMYPQWPACGFFLDFANPVAKVAIECDGREFHDPRKDAERDAILAEAGWRVYRIQGYECNMNGVEDEFGRYIPSPGESLCRKLGENYGIGGRWMRED